MILSLTPKRAMGQIIGFHPEAYPQPETPFRDEASSLEGQADSQGAAKNLKGVDLVDSPERRAHTFRAARACNPNPGTPGPVAAIDFPGTLQGTTL